MSMRTHRRFGKQQTTWLVDFQSIGRILHRVKQRRLSFKETPAQATNFGATSKIPARSASPDAQRAALGTYSTSTLTHAALFVITTSSRFSGLRAERIVIEEIAASTENSPLLTPVHARRHHDRLAAQSVLVVSVCCRSLASLPSDDFQRRGSAEHV